ELTIKVHSKSSGVIPAVFQPTKTFKDNVLGKVLSVLGKATDISYDSTHNHKLYNRFSHPFTTRIGTVSTNLAIPGKTGGQKSVVWAKFHPGLGCLCITR